MSDAARLRIAALQHRKRQTASQEALSRTSDAVGEPRHAPVEAGVSLRLQRDLYARLEEMRGRGALCGREYPDAEGAVSAAEERLKRLGGDVVFEVYLGASGSGFFASPISAAFMSACLRSGCEGLAAVLPNLEAGVLLDVVFDDPLRGNFFEVEWW